MAASSSGERGGRWSDRWEALHRTNVTGLGSLHDYTLAFGPLARETREWWCAQMPMFTVINRLLRASRRLMMAGIHPPDESLPDELTPCCDSSRR